MAYVNARSLALLAAVLATSSGGSAVAQTYYGSPQTAPSPSPQGVACYPPSCNPSCYNIPTGCALIPNPYPGPGSSKENCIELHNGCPTPSGHKYTVTHYYEVWYKIKNVPVYYDEIDYQRKPLHRVCSADHPCPSCVAAGGYGKGEHAGTVTSPEQVEQMNKGVVGATAPAPAVAAPAQAAAPQKQWIWLTNSQAYGYGYIREDGYAIVDPNSVTQTRPASAAAPSQSTVAPSTTVASVGG